MSVSASAAILRETIEAQWLTLLNTYSAPGYVLSTLHPGPHLSLSSQLRRYESYLHFKRDPERLSNCPQITQLERAPGPNTSNLSWLSQLLKSPFQRQKLLDRVTYEGITSYHLGYQLTELADTYPRKKRPQGSCGAQAGGGSTGLQRLRHTMTPGLRARPQRRSQT